MYDVCDPHESGSAGPIGILARLPASMIGDGDTISTGGCGADGAGFTVALIITTPREYVLYPSDLGIVRRVLRDADVTVLLDEGASA